MSYNPAVDKPSTVAEWRELVDYFLAKEPGATRKEIEWRFLCYYPKDWAAQPSPSLEQLKEEKLWELACAFKKACDTATVQTSGGWVADANDTAYRNVQGLLITMENTGLESVQFCDANNEFHAMTQKQLEDLQQLIINRGLQLYQEKWEKRAAIAAAATPEALGLINTAFSS